MSFDKNSLKSRHLGLPLCVPCRARVDLSAAVHLCLVSGLVGLTCSCIKHHPHVYPHTRTHVTANTYCAAHPRPPSTPNHCCIQLTAKWKKMYPTPII